MSLEKSKQQYLSRANVTKWEKNYFMQELKAEIGSPYMKPYKFGTTHETLINAETGEESEHRFVTRKAVDTEQFIKIFENGLRLLSMKAATIRVFTTVLKIYEAEKINSDRFYMAYATAKKHGYDRKQQSWINGINQLIELRVINPAVEPSIYYLNPKFAFRGNRITAIEIFELQNQPQISEV